MNDAAYQRMIGSGATEDKNAGNQSELTLELPEWGFMEGEVFVALPKLPMTRAGFKKPPFDVKLPSGQLRRVIERP